MHRGRRCSEIALRLSYCSSLGVAPLGTRLCQVLAHHKLGTDTSDSRTDDWTIYANLGHLIISFFAKTKQKNKTKTQNQHSFSVWLLAFTIDSGQWGVEHVGGLEASDRVGTGCCSKLTPLRGKMLTDLKGKELYRVTEQLSSSGTWVLGNRGLIF